MKKNFFMVVLVIFIAITIGKVAAQTRQQKNALDLIESEISVQRAELAEINYDLSQLNFADTLPLWQEKQRIDSALKAASMTIERFVAYRAQRQKIGDKLAKERIKIISQKKANKFNLQELNAKRENVLARISELEADKRAINDGRINEAVEQIVPRELKSTEASRRHRANRLRAEEIQLEKQKLGLAKMYSTPVDADPIKGYKGLIWNQTRHTKAYFYIRDASGRDIDGASVFLQPGEKKEAYLLPGQYLGIVYVDGKVSGTASVYSQVNPTTVNGKEYHWFLTKTRDGQ